MVECRVHFHRREMPRVKLQAFGCRKVIRIKHAAPVVVAPGAGSNQDWDLTGRSGRVLYHYLVLRFRRTGWMRSTVAFSEFPFKELERDSQALLREDGIVPGPLV